MRYVVKFWDGKNIIDDMRSNDFDKILKRERELGAIYGKDNVWFADVIVEIMVG
jgi:hypothetical protein